MGWRPDARRGRPGARRPRLPRPREAALAWAELAGLCALAIAEPVFEELRQAPELIAAVELRGGATVLFVVLSVTVPPTLLWLLELAAGVAAPAARRVVHAVLVAFLIAAMFWQAAHGESLDETDLARIAFAVSFCVAVAAYLLTRWLPLVTRVLSLAMPVVAISFLVSPPVGRSVTTDGTPSKQREGPPVVLLVLDELPLASLMSADGRIDADLFPNFARLARQATWYRNARTVADETIYAVPAILTGRYPEQGRVGTSGDYPQSIFTMLGGPVLDGEVVTDLCAPPACADRHGLPYRLSLIARVGASASVTLPFGVLDFDRHEVVREFNENGPGYPKGFDAFLARLGQPGRPPGLAVFHELLPHRPWVYLPSGQTYPQPPGEVAGTWSIPEPMIALAFQRHLLQAQFVDRQLGRLMRTMKRAGFYDEAVLAVTADHGMSFQAGASQRALDRQNAGWVLPVPLLVKSPGQRRGRIDPATTRTIDIVPTVARAAGVEVPESVDGRVAGEPRDDRLDDLYLSYENGFVELGSATIDRALGDAVALRERMIAGGTPFTLGGSADLIGRPARSLGARPLRRVLERELDAVRPDAPRVDAVVSGSLPGFRGRAGARLAFALNGRIVATGEAIEDPYGAPTFATVVPVEALRPGSNRFEVYPLD